MRRIRLLRLIVVPLTVGLGVTALVAAYVRGAVPAAAPVATVPVVVAAAGVPAKTELTRELVVLRPVARELVPPGAASRVDAVVGRVTTVPLARGEVVLESKLASRDRPAGLAYRIPDGLRALTIAVSEVVGVAGFPQPGDAVDILASFSEEVAGAAKTQLLLENVAILAVGQETAVRGDQPAPAGTLTSVTLAVTPEQAVLITLAEQVGRLRLALRPVLGDRGHGGVQLTARSFRIDGPGIELERRLPVSLQVRLLEVDRTRLGDLGLPAGDPGGPAALVARDVSADAWSAAGALVSAGRARLLAQAELQGVSRDVLRQAWLGQAAVYGRAGDQEALGWLDYGLTVDLVPIFYQGDFLDLQLRPTLRVVDLLAPSEDQSVVGGSMEPVGSARSSAAVVRLALGRAVAVAGLVGPADLAAPDGALTRHGLPPEMASTALREGGRELVLLILPAAGPR